jgi:GDP-mannose 6-dehydrogenase
VRANPGENQIIPSQTYIGISTMKIAVFGLGYVGTVSAACLARDGHRVIGVDVNQAKVDSVNSGNATVGEPGLSALIKQVHGKGRLRAVTDSAIAVHESDISLICVGTPSNSNGSLKLTYIENVCREIGRALATRDEYHVVVVRSTVLPQTVHKHVIPVLQEASGKVAGEDFGVCMNPEFLREGSAIADYDQPSLIVIGELDPRSGEVVEDMYESVDAPSVRTSIQTAEMVKYANNAFHALKIVFANEIGNICKSHHVDGQEVMQIFCQDKRLNISEAYLKPGFAFGGSCLPKDLRALMYDAKTNDVECPVLGEVLNSNQKQIEAGIELIQQTGRKNIGILGLSFKAQTDDVRESPVVPIIETLLGRGFTIAVYDENVVPDQLIGSNRAFLDRELPHIASLMRKSLSQVIEDSEVLVVTNGSKAFRNIGNAAREDQIIVDLDGSGKGVGQQRNGNYQGICW